MKFRGRVFEHLMQKDVEKVRAGGRGVALGFKEQSREGMELQGYELQQPMVL